MAVDVYAADEQSDYPVDPLRWARLAEMVLEEAELRGDAELSVLFVDEASITEYNSKFLGHDEPTDVLAFPIDDEPVESGRAPDAGGTGPGVASEPEDIPVLLGDILICPAVAYKNAPEHAGSYEDELALLLVHGLLHLMGMDHQEQAEAEEMEARERELLSRFYKELRPEAWGSDDGAEVGPEGAEGSALRGERGQEAGRDGHAGPK